MADIIADKIQESLDQTVAPSPNGKDDVVSPWGVFSWLVQAGELAPGWWSPARDVYLRRFWRGTNYLSIALYTAVTKLINIDFTVVPRDPSDARAQAEADLYTKLMRLTPGFGLGYHQEMSKFFTDGLSQDNGSFLEILGDGPADGPIIGRATSFRHLDSARVQRTNNPLYPVIYRHDNGEWYKLYWTRVIEYADLPAGEREANGIGYSAVSRVLDIAQGLQDMLRYKGEKMGSRPRRRLILGKGISTSEIRMAFQDADTQADNAGLRLYGKNVAMGNKSTDVDLEIFDLNEFDPFNEEVQTTLGMYAIAEGIGLEVEELWPVSGRSASQGDANLRRARSRGKLPSQLTGFLSDQFGYKFLPAHLMLSFDFQDDSQDQQQAVVRDIRGRNRERDLKDGTIDTRTARTQMLFERDVTRDEFTRQELTEGRLFDGTPISLLFFKSGDPIFARHLALGVPNPLAIQANDPITLINSIQENKARLLAEWAETTSRAKEPRLEQAYYALNWLEAQYKEAAGLSLPPVPTASRRQNVDISVFDDEQQQDNQQR